MNALTQEEFLRDVADHEMTVLREDGVHRHVRFKRPGTGCYHFELITWPGQLCYTGDMGTFVFCRLNDMFDFFRRDREHYANHGRTLAINLGYWGEKLVAVDANGANSGGKAKQFDKEKFTRVINEYRVTWMRRGKEQGTLDKEQRRALWEQVQDEVLDRADDGEHYAQIAAYEFSFRKDGRDWSRDEPVSQFEDLFEHDFTEYTHAFVWCCYALAWGHPEVRRSQGRRRAGRKHRGSSMTHAHHNTSRRTVERLAKIRKLIIALQAGQMMREDIDHLLQMGESTARKCIKGLRDAGIVGIARYADGTATFVGHPVYCIRADADQVDEYLAGLDAAATRKAAEPRSAMASALRDTTRHLHFMADDESFPMRVLSTIPAHEPVHAAFFGIAPASVGAHP